MSLTKVTYSMIKGAAANVLDFGADSTGATDSSAAFTAALALNTGVYFPAGTYLLNYVSVPSNAFIFGDGVNSVIKPLTADIRAAMTLSSASASTYIENVTIRDVKFFGDVVTSGFSEQKHLLTLNGTKNCLIENCQFVGFRGDGIYIGSGDVGGTERHNINVTVKSCFFDGINKDNRQGISIIDGNGILIDGNYFTRTTRSNMPGAIDVEPDDPTTDVVKNISIINNTFYDIGGNVGCISMPLGGTTYTTAPSGFTVENNYINTCTGYGLHFSYSPAGGLSESTANFDVSWVNNYVTNANRPFGIFGTKWHVIEKNSFYFSPQAALLGYTAANDNQIDVSLTNNLFYECGSISGVGLSISNATRLTIQNNEFNDCGTGSVGSYAIDFSTGTSSSVTIQNNNFVTPTGKTLVAIQKEAAHTFTPASNIQLNNRFNGLSDAFNWRIGDPIYASAAPSTQTWAINDRVYNSAPGAGQPEGWVCTVAGTPGTWKAMANLA